MPLPVTDGVPAMPHGYPRGQRLDFYDRERSGTGSVVAYKRHARGQCLDQPPRVGDHSFQPGWNRFVAEAPPRQLPLLGFPPPGHPYWTSQTLGDLTVRYPGLNTRQRAAALPRLPE